jgi:hypothetical protein
MRSADFEGRGRFFSGASALHEIGCDGAAASDDGNFFIPNGRNPLKSHDSKK